MNRFERPKGEGEAVVQYLDGDYRVLKSGSFVRCALTGQPIPLAELRYWSVPRQEAYAGPEVAAEAYRAARRARESR